NLRGRAVRREARSPILPADLISLTRRPDRCATSLLVGFAALWAPRLLGIAQSLFRTGPWIRGLTQGSRGHPRNPVELPSLVDMPQLLARFDQHLSGRCLSCCGMPLHAERCELPD